MKIDIESFWDFDKPAESEARFRAALVHVPVGDPQQVELMTQVARAQGLQRQFEAAHATLTQAAGWLKPDMAQARIRLLLERGRVFNSSKQAEHACPLFTEALALAKESMNDGVADAEFLGVDAAHMLGIAAQEDLRMEYNLLALEMAENAADPRAQRWLGALYNNIGWTYHDQGQFAPALSLFERGQRWREANRRGPQDDGAIRIARWSVARALRSLGEFDQALTLQRAIEADCAKAGEPDGYVYEELGECLLALERPGEAAPQFARAHALLSADAWLAANEAPRLARMAELARGA